MFFRRKILSFDRPYLIKGEELKIKLNLKMAQIDIQITKLNQVLESIVDNDKKQKIRQLTFNLENKKQSLNKLSNVINEKYEYALNLNEADALHLINKE